MSVFLEYFWGVGDLGVPSGGAGVCEGQGGDIRFFEGIESNFLYSLPIYTSNLPLSPDGLSLYIVNK